MKNLLLIICLFFTFSMFAQEKAPQSGNEFYLSTSPDFSSIGIQYKKGISDDTYLRAGLANVSAKIMSFLPVLTTTGFPYQKTFINGKFKAGIEKRKPINNRTSFFYGLDLLVQSDFSRQHFEDPTLPARLRNNDLFTFGAGFGVPLGFLVELSERFFCSVEVEPELIYKGGYQNAAENKTILNFYEIVLGRDIVQLALIYRF